jgi:murein DD-endopeptidase MepM/ murein hydrolase activator NlpD
VTRSTFAWLMVLALATLTSVVTAAVVLTPVGFTYLPPGNLTPGSGTGRNDSKIYLPTMRFPIETTPAFANSQVWGMGGSEGPSGSQCDASNYSYPWRDNYCETRTSSMPLCPAGTGHQGQDIRPSTCVKDTHWVVAAIAGTVTSVGSYSVYVTADDGSATRVDYLHMSSVQGKVNDKVKVGQRLGKVSNEFGGGATTIHLHFNVMQKDALVGFVFVPPYASLVEAYKALP